MKKKQQKVIIFNEKGVRVRKCPHCKSSRLRRTVNKGFECLRCHFINKRRFSHSPKDIGKVTFVTY